MLLVAVPAMETKIHWARKHAFKAGFRDMAFVLHRLIPVLF